MNYKSLLSTVLISTSLLGSVTGVAASQTAENAQQVTSESKTTNTKNTKVTKNTELDEKSEKKESVRYNGKTMNLPVGPNNVAPEKKITDKTQGTMGELARKSNKARTSTDIFSIGDKDKPDVDFIDVSSYQYGMTPQNFDYMKSKGLRGVVVKLTEGTGYRNPEARQQIESAKKAGIKVSTYHFSRFKNKQQAEAEADAYARYAIDLGLPKSTVMVNDIEAAECNNGYATSNSIWFAKRLIDHWGFSTVIHYGYQSWFEQGVLNYNQLGKDSIWMASYPYHPSRNDLWFKGYVEAWQFSSTMTVPGYTNSSRPYIDANIDYTGRFTHSVSRAYELNNCYVTVNKKGHNIYSDKALSDPSQSTSNVYHHTFQAKRYYIINGTKYYSIYDENNQWIGYISEKDVRKGDSKGGAHFSQEDKYAVVTKNDYTIWSDFNFSSKKGMSHKDDDYQVRGLYYHINGSTYASLYDREGNWKGYINVKALDIENNDFGAYHPYGKYMTVSKGGYGIYKDKNFNKKVSTSDEQMHKTFFVKGYYDRFTNGRRYYSLYSENENGELTWEGYVGKGAMRLGYNDGTSKGGAYFAQEGKYATVKKDDYTLWRNFNFSSSNGKAKKDDVYQVRGLYYHINGFTYASLYDKDENWKGYINIHALDIEDNDFGPYHSYGKYMTVSKGGYGIYKDKNFKKKVSTSDEQMNKTFFVKGYYDRFTNGRRYYSLYSENRDGKLTWEGYVGKGAMQLVDDVQ